MLRSSTITLPNYLQLLAENLTRLYRTGGRLKQTLVDSSFDAWTKFYKQDENAPNAIVSYYNKGAVVALGLDVTLRLVSQNRVSLDDLMRRLWADYGKTQTGVNEGDIEMLAEEIAGCSLKEFFDLCLRSTDELPVKEWLKALGIGMRLRSEKNGLDQGGYIDNVETDKGNEFVSNLTLGCRLQSASTEILNVFKDSAAEQCGLCPGDTIIALDGKKVTADNYEKVVARLVPGKTVRITVFRRDYLHEYMIRPEQKPENVCDLFLLPESESSDLQRQIQASWLASNIPGK
jgi:predicted metalloprotease with PDZ domain